MDRLRRGDQRPHRRRRRCGGHRRFPRARRRPWRSRRLAHAERIGDRNAGCPRVAHLNGNAHPGRGSVLGIHREAANGRSALRATACRERVLRALIRTGSRPSWVLTCGFSLRMRGPYANR